MGEGTNMGNTEDWIYKFMYWKSHPWGDCIGRWVFGEVIKRSLWVGLLSVMVSFLLTTCHKLEWPEHTLHWGNVWIGLISSHVFEGFSLLFEVGKIHPEHQQHHFILHWTLNRIIVKRASWTETAGKQACVHFIHSSLDWGCYINSYFEFILWSLLCDGLWLGIINQINLVIP